MVVSTFFFPACPAFEGKTAQGTTKQGKATDNLGEVAREFVSSRVLCSSPSRRLVNYFLQFCGKSRSTMTKLGLACGQARLTLTDLLSEKRLMLSSEWLTLARARAARVRLRCGSGTVRAVPVFGSSSSSGFGKFFFRSLAESLL